MPLALLSHILLTQAVCQKRVVISVIGDVREKICCREIAVYYSVIHGCRAYHSP